MTRKKPLITVLCCLLGNLIFNMSCSPSTLLKPGTTLTPLLEDDQGNTPLHWAVKSGNHQEISRLLAAGASPTAINAVGLQPIDMAILEDDLPTLEFMHQLQPLKPNSGSQSVLLEAARRGYWSIVNKALEYGLDINAGSDYTLMHYAASQQNISQMHWLKQHGSDINRQTGTFKQSPLEYTYKTLAIAQALLELGADINLKNPHSGATVAHSAAQYDLKGDVLEFLLKQGANMNQYNWNGHTPVHVAAVEGNIIALRIMAQHHTDFSSLSWQGQGIFQLALTNLEPEDLHWLSTVVPESALAQDISYIIKNSFQFQLTPEKQNLVNKLNQDLSHVPS